MSGQRRRSVKKGDLIGTVADYADAIRDRVTLQDAPPLFDGTWQPGSTNGVSKWLGDRSIWALGGPPVMPKWPCPTARKRPG